jgi:hypothetical protein
VAIDSRIELFPVETWAEYETVASGGDGWQGVLERWHVTLAVVATGDDTFASRLVAAGWQSTFAGSDGRVFAAPGRR